MTNQQKEKIANLRLKGLSYTEIADRLNVSRAAVVSFCRRNDLQASQPDTDVCRECGSALVQTPGMKRRVFCSAGCRVRWWKAHPERLSGKATYHFVCKKCVKPFSAYGNAKRKYCCHECYIEDRFGGGKDE